MDKLPKKIIPDQMPKDSWIMIDRTQFNLEDIKIERIYSGDGYLYVHLNRNKLKERLDKYHFEYLLDCFDGKPLISFEHNLDKDEWDYETYQKIVNIMDEKMDFLGIDIEFLATLNKVYHKGENDDQS